MCDMCNGYIYDVLTTPLPIDHLLRNNINIASVKKCASELTECFQRALEKFTASDVFLHVTVHEKDHHLKRFKEEEIIWSRFNRVYHTRFHEIQHAIEICMDNGVGRKTTAYEQVVTHFLMNRLRILLTNLTKIHIEHTMKPKYVNPGSKCNISYQQLAQIRMKAGLPVPPMNVIYPIYDNFYD
jgi:hypothetical protein